MENNTFSYTYSAKRNREVERIRRKYLPPEENKLETLKKLDSRVQSAGLVESLCVGIIGALVFGIGMCFGLGVFSGAEMLSILFCPLGASMMLCAYPIYKRLLNKTKLDLTPEILRLSDEIINS